MSVDRLVHLLIGLAFLVVYVRFAKVRAGRLALVLLAVSVAVGTWLPDWDLFFGIGYHRSPLTHSLLPALVLGGLAMKVGLPRALVVGLSLGIASHLLWDIVDYGNVQWIDGGNRDRMFLLVNAGILLVAAWVFESRAKLGR